jgi:hypothetical protein
MNAKRRRRHQPAIEAGGRNRPLLVKESRSCTGYAPGAADCCHRYFPLRPNLELGVCFTVFEPVVFSYSVEQPHPAVPCDFPERAGSTRAFENFHPDVLIMLAAMPAN